MAPALVEKYKRQSAECQFKFLYDALASTVKCEADYRLSNNQRLLVEFLLIKLSQMGKPQEPAAPMQTPMQTTVQAPVQVPAQATVQPQATVQTQTTVQTQAQASVQIQDKPSVQIPVAGQATYAVEVTNQTKPAATAGLSIKGIMKKAQVATAVSVTESNIVKEDKPITKEALLAAWTKMGESQTAYPRLGTAIKQSEPQLEEDNVTVIFNVSNSAQKVWIEKNSILGLTKFLQDELENKKLRLEVRVKEIAPQEKKLYMPHEKAEFLLKNNPELRELHKELDLDIK